LITALAVFIASSFLSTITVFAGQAHIIVDADTGRVLASSNADVLNHPASLTKMMTLYMTFEALREGKLQWEQEIVMTRNAASKIPFKLGLAAGQTLTVREAVYGMAIRSANDAAAAMGDHLGGNEASFGLAMTAKARQIGMTNTVFRNASGLPDSKQVTTARDLATLAAALISKFPNEYKIFSQRSFEFRGKQIPGHNNLMYRYPGMDGIKTGFVNASGFNLASAVKIGNRRIIGVVLGGKSAKSRDAQMEALLDKSVSPATGAPEKDLVATLRPGMPAKAPGRIVPLFSAPSSPNSASANPAPANPTPVNPAPAAPAPSAPPVASLAPTTGTLRGPVDRDRSDWMIQVGAGNQTVASRKLVQAAQMLETGFPGLEPNISATSKPDTLFRARLAGFMDQKQASNACQLLIRKRMDCFIVSDSN
jgi:D-alanyl-D-alanine carboxypeptidase (penicillin-binding protein 5/6)